VTTAPVTDNALLVRNVVWLICQFKHLPDSGSPEQESGSLGILCLLEIFDESWAVGVPSQPFLGLLT